jgi:outer membrane protein assembly factor BamB
VPAGARGLVLVGANDSVYRALRIDTGAEVWRLVTTGPIKDTGTLVGDTVYFTSLVGTLYAVRAADGTIMWQARLPGKTRSSPTYVPPGILIVGTDDGSVVGVDAATGLSMWRLATDHTNMIGSATLVRSDNGFVAWMSCGPTSVCALRPTTGEVIQRVEIGAQLTGVPTLVRGALYVAPNAPGQLARFDPSHL